jgi:hypothetical protein
MPESQQQKNNLVDHEGYSGGEKNVIAGEVRPPLPAPKRLPAALAANIWKPGQSGNPKGLSGAYGEAISLARQAAPDAVRRLMELMHSDDERVAAVACNAILDRALGKPRQAPEADGKDEIARLSDAELSERLVGSLVRLGLSPRRARTLVNRSPSGKRRTQSRFSPQ